MESGGSLRRVGRYQLVERIPGGGMTEVYRARVAAARGPERPLVLKLLPPATAKSAESEARFVEEAKIALALAHGNIVTTFEAGRGEDGQLFLVMEFVHGGSLRDLIKSGEPLPVEPALFIAREVARALRFTHTYVEPGGTPTPHAHLDVSPENILLSYSGQVKLTDFGIARAVGSLSGLSGPWGKARYAAPELLEGDLGGPPADIYGLGCVLYEMLTGAPPFVGRDDAETLRLARSGPPAPPPSRKAWVEPEVDSLVRRMLERDPAERMNDAGEVERSLTAILGRSERPFTEPELSTLVHHHCGPPAAASETDADRLRAQLDAAGVATGSGDSTGELLALGTVPLPGAEPPAPGPSAADGAPPGDASIAAPASATLGELPPAALGDLPPATLGELPPASAYAAPTPPRRWPWAVVALILLGGGGLWWVASARGTAGGGAESRGAGVEGASAGTATGGQTGESPEVESAGGSGGEVSAGGSGDATSGTGEETVAGAGETTAESGTGTAKSGTTRIRKPASRKPALLQINSYPYAEVYLADGRRLGTTPLRDVQLPPGKQTLLFKNPELGLQRRVELRLRPGQRRTVGVRLDR